MSVNKKQFKTRKIYLHGEVNEEMALKFSRRISLLERESKKLPITIELSSEGGTAYDALTIASRMRISPCDISVECFGLVASAAVIILAYGDKRFMTKESWVMVHEDHGTGEGSVSDLERNIAHSRRMETQWYDLMAGVTITSSTQWAHLHKLTTYLTAEECLNLGLIEGIL